MFKRVIGEVRERLSEITRIMGPPKPMVGQGMQPQKRTSPIKPALQPATTPPHGMGGTGMAKSGGTKPAHMLAGKQKPISSGRVGQTLGNSPAPKTGSKPPQPGTSSGTTRNASTLGMTGRGK